MVCLAALAADGDPVAYFQAHRGGLEEVPENTLVALQHAWAIPGAVPEVDLRTTSDGVIFCVHDEMLDRTVAVPEGLQGEKVEELTWDAIKDLDAGSSFDAKYAGETMPTLDQVFEELKATPDRQMYLDLKAVDLDALGKAIELHGVAGRIIFVHGSPDYCAELQERFPGARTMTWLSGSPPLVSSRYKKLKAKNFKGVSQLQFHLRAREFGGNIQFALTDAFIQQAAKETKAAGVDLQLRPFKFDGPSLRKLLDFGAKWYVADAPQAFYEALQEAEKKK
jgi:glycerophosphoryl diester phosphodiesterase